VVAEDLTSPEALEAMKKEVLEQLLQKIQKNLKVKKLEDLMEDLPFKKI
jgi:hypothetical protein